MPKYRLVYALVAALCFCKIADAQTIQMRNRELVNSLFASMNPDLLDNSYLPPMVKEKLRWIIRENQARPSKLVITPTDKWSNASTDVIASSDNWPGVTPKISISAESVAHFAKGTTKTGLKDLFLLSLAHEAIHLEIPLKQSASPDEILKEEIRTWHKWLPGAVRPMILEHRLILADWVFADQVLRICNDKPECPAFQEVVKQHIPKIR